MELITHIRDITSRCFAAIELLRRVDNGATYAFERMYERLMQDLDTAEQLALRAYDRRVAEDIKYALVALADETAQRQPGPLRDFWKPRALQLYYFRDNRAGFGFFDRLAEIQADPGRHAALPVYALSLQFGLRGKYEHDEHGGERELRARREAVFAAAAELVHAGGPPPPLAITSHRTGDPRRPARRPRSYLWVGFGLLLFVTGFYLFARNGLGSMTSELVERLHRRAPAPST